MNGLLSAVLLVLVWADPGQSDPFSVNGVAAREAVVTAPWHPGFRDSFPDIPDSPMLRTLAGIVGPLSSRDLGLFRRAAESRTRLPEDLGRPQPIASIHLAGRGSVARVELERVADGWILVRPAGALLAGDAVESVVASWPASRPEPDSGDGFPVGRAFGVPGPLVASHIRLDRATVAERLAAGGGSLFPEPLARDLAHERMTARLPGSYRPDRPAGLLVWISPDPAGELPESLFAAADALGLICITSAQSGYDRPAIDRFQLALDAVATASGRWWIDPERVYAAGLSGGARVASTLWACFPDVFTGAVCVAGLNSHHRVPIGDGRAWPATHALPGGRLVRLLASHRLGVMTGPRETNFNEIQARSRAMARDGLGVRVFDHADLGHEMPRSEHFTGCLRWVDSAVLSRRAESAEQAARLLEEHIARHGEGRPPDARSVRLLERITVIAPWTDPAWDAARLLGYTDPATPASGDGG